MMFAMAYGAAFGAIQQIPQIVPGLPEVREMVAGSAAAAGAADRAGRCSRRHEGPGGRRPGRTRRCWPCLAVVIVSRRKLIRMFQIPGLIVMPIVFALVATSSLSWLYLGDVPRRACSPSAQFSFWGNYLPRVYPVHLRGTGESFAANIGGRLIGTSFAWVTATLAVTPDRAYAPTKVALVAAGVGFSRLPRRLHRQLLAARAAGGHDRMMRVLRSHDRRDRGLGRGGHVYRGWFERAGVQAGATDGDLQGKLYKSVFSTGVGALKYEDLPTAPEALRTRLARYLSRRSAFKSGYKSGADSFEAVRVEAKRRMIEQAIVALIETPGIERMATEYVTAAPISYEWKGLHDGPMEELGARRSAAREGSVDAARALVRRSS